MVSLLFLQLYVQNGVWSRGVEGGSCDQPTEDHRVWPGDSQGYSVGHTKGT